MARKQASALPLALIGGPILFGVLILFTSNPAFTLGLNIGPVAVTFWGAAVAFVVLAAALFLFGSRRRGSKPSKTRRLHAR